MKHCHSVGESYAQHLAFAVGYGTNMVLGGVACMIHGLLPFAFTRTGSRTVFDLYERINGGARRVTRHLTAGATREGSRHFNKKCNADD